MKMKHIFLLAILLVLLTGCELLGGTKGTYSLDSNDIRTIQVTNDAAGKTFTVQDQSSIRSLVKLINALTLDTSAGDADPVYTLDITYQEETDAQQITLLRLSVANKTTVTTDSGSFTVDAEDLLTQLEKLECDTLTDNELLRSIFEDDYWDTVSITNEKGELSVDKILSLPDQCPALFELLSRPSALKSVAGDGLALLEKYASSADAAVRERAEKLGEIFSGLLPGVKDKISDILDGLK